MEDEKRENNEKENWQTQEMRGAETKAPLHLHKATTLIQAMMDQDVADVVAKETRDGNLIEETLSTHKLQ